MIYSLILPKRKAIDGLGVTQNLLLQAGQENFLIRKMNGGEERDVIKKGRRGIEERVEGHKLPGRKSPARDWTSLTS